VLLAAAASVALGAGAYAQSPDGEPTYGSVTLEAGFSDDPHAVSITAGGDIDASGVGCVGMIADAPDYDLYYTPGDLPLYLSAESGSDVSLIVNLPDGSWACDDDSAGNLNPGLTFDSPQSGLYDVWIGAVGDGANGAEATLYISELGYGADGSSGGGATGIDATGTPYFGEVSLTSGFSEDPYSVYISAGGSNDASSLGGSCVGAIGGPPDFNLTYSAGSLPLYLTATSDSDVTLVVNAPDGSWYCDDDSAGSGTDAGLTWSKPQSGLYNVWVGHYSGSGGETVEATLNVSETGYHTTRAGGAATGIDPGAEPAYGNVELTAGFTPDPYTLDLTPGGDNDARSVDESCAGQVASAPDFDLYYTPGAFPLYIYVESDDDTTLVINTPDGEWICDDDSGVGLNPGVGFKAPAAGLYDIWVGRFGGAEGSATLNISETNFPRD
jgi:hypothetical protein